MTRAVALPVAIVAVAMLARAADPSPQSKPDEPDAFDIEPAILKQNLSNDLSSAALAPDRDAARLEKKLEHAKQSAAGADRLCKIGVLARVEVEQRLLRVVQCEADLANARLSLCTGDVAALEARVASGEDAKDELAKAKATLAELGEAAQIATAKRERAELEFAETNLRRQQKLLKLGIAQKSDVARAEEKLAELKAPKQ
jgi:multidrug resistance efflux pump